MYLTNKETKQVAIFGCTQGSDWEKSTQSEIEGFGLEKDNKNIIADNKAYLSSTDWIVTKSIDTGVAYSQEIKDKRILARLKINEIESVINGN